MSITNKFFGINIRDYLTLGTDDEAGEPELIRTISEFSCPKNPDVERFLKKSAQAVSDTDESYELVQLLRLL